MGVLGHPRRLRAPALEKRLTLQTVDQAFCLLSAETREFPVASERSLILGRITRPDATPRNPNAMIRKGADTALNKTRYDIRRLNRLLNVRHHCERAPR